MRINKYIAQATGMSRRAADAVIGQGRVRIDGRPVQAGQDVSADSNVTLDNRPLDTMQSITTIMLNKPRGYVVSRNGQGSKTIYELLPTALHHLKPVGRLDKDSSGLLLLTNDGDLAQKLTHPKYQKTKVYEVMLDKPLTPEHRRQISHTGVELEDGPSKLRLEKLDKDGRFWQITMQEGRNRQIRRTFTALNYTITSLHRTQFGSYSIGKLLKGNWCAEP